MRITELSLYGIGHFLTIDRNEKLIDIFNVAMHIFEDSSELKVLQIKVTPDVVNFLTWFFNEVTNSYDSYSVNHIKM